MLTKELKKEILGLYPEWRNDVNISDKLYDLLDKWADETADIEL